jgi:hypothetical protein
MAPLHVEEKQWRSGTIALLAAKGHPVKPGKTALASSDPNRLRERTCSAGASLRVLIKRGCHHARYPW